MHCASRKTTPRVVPPMQNFMLYLWKAGVGSKWTTGHIMRDGRFFEIIGVDASEAFVVGMLWYGYPKMTPTQSRTRSRTF